MTSALYRVVNGELVPLARRDHLDCHVMPDWQDHDSEPTCWCGPTVDYTEPLNGGRVWLHRTANDAPHHADPTEPETHPEADWSGR